MTDAPELDLSDYDLVVDEQFDGVDLADTRAMAAHSLRSTSAPIP